MRFKPGTPSSYAPMKGTYVNLLLFSHVIVTERREQPNNLPYIYIQIYVYIYHIYISFMHIYMYIYIHMHIYHICIYLYIWYMIWYIYIHAGVCISFWRLICSKLFEVDLSPFWALSAFRLSAWSMGPSCGTFHLAAELNNQGF